MVVVVVVVVVLVVVVIVVIVVVDDPDDGFKVEGALLTSIPSIGQFSVQNPHPPFGVAHQ